MNLLLVKDDAGVADFVLRGLRAEGWCVEALSDAETGLERLRATHFDAVVLDLTGC